MAVSQRNPDWEYFYNRSFRRAAHQLLSWGHEDAKSYIQPNHLEEQITGFIVNAILKRLDDPLTPSKYRRYYVLEEDYVREGDGTGRGRQRLDIVVVSSTKLPRPAFVFEAKILRKNGFPIGLYAGSGGMQCFVKGEYACDYPCAAMVGYFQSDDADRWINELERVFNEDLTGELNIKQGLQKVEVLPNLTFERISRHSRLDNNDIDIYHIFLDCC